jgi:tetratricopeptide (TPR) repeat protein
MANPDTKTAGYYLRKGTVQFEAEMYSYSKGSFLRVLDIDPKNTTAMNYLAEIALKKLKKLDAIEWYEKSLAVNPHQGDIHFKVAVLYEFYIEDKKAFHSYLQAIRYNKNHHKAHTALVRLYMERDNKTEAYRHFNKARAIALEDQKKPLASAQQAYISGHYKKALKLYRKITRSAPSLVEAYMRTYQSAVRLKEYDEAVKVLEALVKIKPDHEKAFYLLGEAYYSMPLKIKRVVALKRSVDNFKKALKLNPNKSDTHIALADVYLLLNEKDLAAKHLSIGNSLDDKGK